MVQIYQDSTGQRIKAFPWTYENIGDFSLHYTLPTIGNYDIVLSIANDDNGNNHNGIDSPRAILMSNLNCDCDRGVLGASITRNFGNIFYTAIFGGVAAAMAVFVGAGSEMKFSAVMHYLLQKNEIYRFYRLSYVQCRNAKAMYNVVMPLSINPNDTKFQ